MGQGPQGIFRLDQLGCRTRGELRQESATFTQLDKRISNIIANIADEKGLQCTRLNSGAGHDAQMMARICPTSMIFVPSKDGISHNPREYTSKEHLNYGLQILYETINRIDSNLLD